MTVSLALLAALIWGVSDFVGGLASRGVQPLVVVIWVNGLGLAACGIAWLALGASVGPAGLAWSLGTGVIGSIAFVTFYAALSAGPMSLAAPLTASGAALPAVVGLAQGERITAILGAGLALAFAGGVCASRPPVPGRGHVELPRRALVLALAAAAAIGIALSLLQQASDAPGTDALAIVAIERAVGLVLCLTAARARRTDISLPAAARLPILLVALTDVLAIGLFTRASHGGHHAIVAVVASLYPITTVLLAGLVLRERLGRTQGIGVALAFAGIACIASG